MTRPIVNSGRQVPDSKRKQPNQNRRDLREAKFAEEYVIDFNGTQAAIRAGCSEKGA